MGTKFISPEKFQKELSTFTRGVFRQFHELEVFGHADFYTIGDSPNYVIHTKDDIKGSLSPGEYDGDLWDGRIPEPEHLPAQMARTAEEYYS